MGEVAEVAEAKDARRIKAELRAAFLARRRTVSAEDAARHCGLIHDQVRALPGWKDLNTVLVYLPLPGEVDTWPLVHELWKRGARTLAPCCRDCTGELDFFEFQAIQDLSPGRFGILEPDRQTCAQRSPEDSDAVLVPALAFDRDGFRLGFGGGYYDRLLSRLGPNMLTIGLGFDFQLVDILPRETHDQPVRVVCTEQETVWARK
jgi:5-formyltetrahydrofolate cyclo-ligase